MDLFLSSLELAAVSLGGPERSGVVLLHPCPSHPARLVPLAPPHSTVPWVSRLTWSRASRLLALLWEWECRVSLQAQPPNHRPHTAVVAAQMRMVSLVRMHEAPSSIQAQNCLQVGVENTDQKAGMMQGGEASLYLNSTPSKTQRKDESRSPGSGALPTLLLHPTGDGNFGT